MKFKNILLELSKNKDLLEQIDPENDIEPVDDEPVDDEPVDDEPVDDEPEDIRYTPQQWSNPIKITIQKWLNERPGLTLQEIDNSIIFFNGRKNNLRPFKGTVTNPDPHNIPEIISFKQRFPDFPSEDIQKLKDITQYSWEELEYFIDRFSETEAIIEIDDTIDGITYEQKLASAINIWKNFPSSQKLIDEHGVILIRVESKEESIALGRLQHILVGKYGGTKWCITRGHNDGTNLYNSYRTTKSFYFILDQTKPESFNEFVSAIYVENDFYNTNTYIITRRENSPSSEPNKTWNDLINKWPSLKKVKNQIIPFKPTRKERIGQSLDNIDLTYRSPNDLAIQPKSIQRLYIENNRLIQSSRVFLSLPKDLQHMYIAKTTLEDYKTRFVCKDSSDPYRLLNTINEIPSLFKFLNESVLKRQLGIKSGVYTIKASMLKLNLINDFVSDKGNIRMFKNRYNYYGVINIENLEWIKNLQYKREKYVILQNNSKTYFVFKHVSSYDNDYFYWIISSEQFFNKKPRGNFYTKELGDEFIKNSIKI